MRMRANFISVRFKSLSASVMPSPCVSKLYTAWNTAIRILFNVHRDTHRYLIESISQCLHVITMLASRCVLYVEGFDDYLITEMINMLCNE